VRAVLLALRIVRPEELRLRMLAPRSPGARYAVEDVLHYQRGSKEFGIEKQSYARVVATNFQEDLLPV
jgi:hypothetical protein